MLPEDLAPRPKSLIQLLVSEHRRLIRVFRMSSLCFIVLFATLTLLTIALPMASNSIGQLAHCLHLDRYPSADNMSGFGFQRAESDVYATTATYWYLTSTKSYEIQQAMSATLGPALLLTTASGIIAMAGSIASQTKLVEVQREGVMVRKKGASYALFVPWEFLTKVDITELPDWFGKKNYRLVFHTDDGVKVSMTWRDVLTSQQGSPLLNALKTWAPEAITECKLPVPDSENTQTNYTQLWLQYFSAPARRERSTDLEPGATICGGKYRIAGKLSGGGHGTTYLSVFDQSNETEDSVLVNFSGDVVVKEYVLPVHRGSLVLERTIEKLTQEAAILRRISHPQIVGLLDTFVEDYRGYLVMEYVQGVSLKDLVERQGPQQEAFVCRLAIQMCEVLTYLHALTPAVIHRDFTPDNLILQDNMQVKLVDFNVAHELEGSVTATVVGKHSYLPPEQFRGKPVPQSDIYALGCTLFYLLTGTDPVPISPSHPREQRKDVSEELDRIIAQATALDSGRRYADADAMKAELALFLERQQGYVS